MIINGLHIPTPRFFCHARAVVAFALLVLIGGCSDTVEMTQDREDRLHERVTARWAAINLAQYDEAWAYSTPNFRGVFPKHLYQQKFSQLVNNELTGIEVTSYDSRAAVASVAVRVMAEPTKFASPFAQAAGALPDTIYESWLFVEGDWWYIDRTRKAR